jgi:secretion/DNA translocation related TadE-like protein
VLVLAGILACFSIGGMWLTSGRAGLARQRAESAADLAALAGAQALARADPSPCGAAGIAASANGGQLIACAVAGDALTVSVSVSTPTRATSVARAGPQDAQ